MTLLAVNYHYLAAEPPPNARAIFPISIADFESQLKQLARGFTFVSRDELLKAVEGNGVLPSEACLVTFDDGLRSQYELALPILRRLGIPAVFFLSGVPLINSRVLHVHRVHHLRQTIPEAEFRALLDEALIAEGVHVPDVPETVATRTYRYDSPAAAEVKYLLNVALEPALREQVVANMFSRAIADEADFCRDLYIGPSEARELERRDGAVGVHGFEHRPLATLSSVDAQDDLRKCGLAVEQITGRRPRMVSYPYGSANAVTVETAAAAADLGFSVGFTMERAINTTLEQPLLLARVDTNDAPGGRAPLFKTGPPLVVDGSSMSGARTRYFTEPTSVDTVMP